MKIVGLTGGIGSGKTTVAKMFGELGVPIYIADVEAKGVIRRSKIIKQQLITLFGKKAYSQEELNRPYIAAKIFKNESLLSQMNAIVHPKVRAHFKRWVKRQESQYIIYEAAILFEHDGHKQCDYVITVTAPKKERFKRILERDDVTKEHIKSVMSNQWPDEKKIELSDFIIENKSLKKTLKKVEKIHKQILQCIQ